MTLRPFAYLLVGTIFLWHCAGSEDAVEPILTVSEDSLQIEEPALDTSKNNLPSEEITALDENCDIHFAAAMNQSKPDDLIILHCEYWSSGHPVWLEHSYKFEFEKNELFFDDIVDYNAMVRIEDNELIKAQQSDWFLPKDISNYEGYYTEDDFDDFEVFKDIKTGGLFIRGSQY